jgi:hypothetical protein
MVASSGSVLVRKACHVTGIRSALEQSLSVKRNADSHIDVISAEDIGKMPDKNVELCELRRIRPDLPT